MRCRLLLRTVFAVLTLLFPSVGGGDHSITAVADKSLSFRVSFRAAVRQDSADGRVYVIIDRKDDTAEPRLGVDITGVPLLGQDIIRMRPREQGGPFFWTGNFTGSPPQNIRRAAGGADGEGGVLYS